MILIDLEVIKYDEEGEPYKETTPLSFPEKIQEITLAQWVAFQDKLAELPEWMAIEQDEPGIDFSPTQWAEYYQTIAGLLACFSGTAKELLSLPLGAFDTGMGGSILHLFGSITKLLNEYKPTSRKSFKYKGDVYIIPQSESSAFGDENPGADIRVIEAVQALQSEQVLSQTDEHGNPVIENAAFHIDLAILAALCRKRMKDGTLEQMPLSIERSEKFMKERMAHLEGITMDVARDVYFFLVNSKLRSLTIRLSESLSSLRLGMQKRPLG